MAGYIGSKAAVVTPGAERIKTYAITSTTTVLTGLVYSPGFVHVFHNGVRLTSTTDYTATDGSTITLLTAAQNGDEVVVVSYATFQIADTVSASAGGTFQNAVSFSAGSASIPGISVTGDTNTGLFSPAADTVAVATAGAERVRVNSSGNVGIGASSPNYSLTSYKAGAVANYIQVASGSTGAGAANGALFGVDASGNGVVNVQGAVNYITSVAGLERMRIDSSGRVTIPSQTSFFARPPASYAINGDTTVGGTWTVVRNNGNNFNASGGIFTAPVTGVYSFVWSAFITDDYSRRDSYLLVNDAQVARTEIIGYPTTTSNISSLVAASLYLNANDAVKFGAHSQSGNIYTATTPWSYACGHFLG